MNEPIQLVPTKSDHELAQEFKDLVLKESQPILNALEQIKKAGFDCNISFGMNAFGKMQVTNLILVKTF